MEDVRIFDSQGRFVARIAASNLFQFVANNSRLTKGWVLVGSSPLWIPIQGLPVQEEERAPSSGIRPRVPQQLKRAAG